LNINQVVVENLPGNIHQSEDLRISDRIENILPFLAADNEIAATEQGQLLRKSALLHLELAAQFVDANFAGPQCIENGNSQWVTQRLELCFESSEIVHLKNTGISRHLWVPFPTGVPAGDSGIVTGRVGAWHRDQNDLLPQNRLFIGSALELHQNMVRMLYGVLFDCNTFILRPLAASIEP
jgi:hypothetical protein